MTQQIIKFQLENYHGSCQEPPYPVHPLQTVQLSTDPTSGEVHLRHHVTKDGYYRGKKVIETKGAVSVED